MNKQKGFTIIELIVVIAIIAVLAAIVLINVTTYINKSKDASIKANLHTIQTAFISTNYQTSSTWAAPTTTDYTLAKQQIETNNGTGTYSEILIAGGFCATSPLASTGATAWCVDSTGFAGDLVATKCTTGVGTCQ